MGEVHAATQTPARVGKSARGLNREHWGILREGGPTTECLGQLESGVQTHYFISSLPQCPTNLYQYSFFAHLCWHQRAQMYQTHV